MSNFESRAKEIKNIEKFKSRMHFQQLLDFQTFRELDCTLLLSQSYDRVRDVFFNAKFLNFTVKFSSALAMASRKREIVNEASRRARAAPENVVAYAGQVPQNTNSKEVRFRSSARKQNVEILTHKWAPSLALCFFFF